MERVTNYILIDREVIPCSNFIEWCNWMENPSNRVVKKQLVDVVENTDDRIVQATVSTVFLGSDHSFGRGNPLLFETMIFNAIDYEDYQQRCSTYDEAIAMHDRAIATISRNTINSIIGAKQNNSISNIPLETSGDTIFYLEAIESCTRQIMQVFMLPESFTEDSVPMSSRDQARIYEMGVDLATGSDYPGYIDSFAIDPKPAVCQGCAYYSGDNSGSNHLVCAVHPYGCDSDICPDWLGN